MIGLLLAVALVALLIFSLTQLAPFFRSSNPQYGRVVLTALAVTGAITLIQVLVLRWLDRREPEPWALYVPAFAWGGLIANSITLLIIFIGLRRSGRWERSVRVEQLRYGEDAWMGPWKEVYARPAGAKPDIVAELRGIADPDARNSAPMILDNIDGVEQARAALTAAFDDPAVTELRVFNLGDGGAMSGLLVAGRRQETDETTFLVFLMD